MARGQNTKKLKIPVGERKHVPQKTSGPVGFMTKSPLVFFQQVGGEVLYEVGGEGSQDRRGAWD